MLHLKSLPCSVCGKPENCDERAVRFTCGSCVVTGLYRRAIAYQDELAIYGVAPSANSNLLTPAPTR